MPIYRRKIIKGAVIPALVSLSGCEGSFPSEMEETTISSPKPMTPFDATEPETFSKVNRQDLELTIHHLVNDERSEQDIDSLGFNEDLAYIARTRSRDMAVKGYFAHTEPDGDTYIDRLREYGYDSEHSGENLAKPTAEPGTNIQKIAKRTVTSWMGSPTHRENMMKPSFNLQGIGAYVTDNNEIYITQIFDGKLHQISAN